MEIEEVRFLEFLKKLALTRKEVRFLEFLKKLALTRKDSEKSTIPLNAALGTARTRLRRRWLRQKPASKVLLWLRCAPRQTATQLQHTMLLLQTGLIVTRVMTK
jgi:hypothetical protein